MFLPRRQPRRAAAGCGLPPDGRAVDGLNEFNCLREGVAVFAQRPTDLFHGESSHDALITSGLPKKAATIMFAKDLGASFDVSAEGPIEP